MKTITFDETTWTLVPVEPTPEMIAAANRARVYKEDGDMSDPDVLSARTYNTVQAWAEALRLAPTPPATEPNMCAQCKKAYRTGASSTGCPKCAPGVSIPEAEFREPLCPTATDQAEPVARVAVSVPHLRSIVVQMVPDAPVPPVGAMLYTAQPATDAGVVEDSKRADMIWNSDDAETQYGSVDEMLNDLWGQGCGPEVGTVFTVWRGIRLPEIKIIVTAVDDNEGSFEYEEIDAARAGRV